MANTDTEAVVQVYDEAGNAVHLTTALGEGGQGKVYRLKEDDGLLAKIYKKDEDLSEKLPRLQALLAMDSERLRKAGAWPHRPLRNAQGETVGFVMEFLQGWVPLHKVYQIKSRLTLIPNADFGFLVRVARNLATCVHYMHEAGIVIGDLNESNTFVSGNAMVKLIDSDSVQVESDGKLFTCDVGRPELISPELQGHSLTGKWRTPEQDRFALAVLVFQTLTFGRHPFAGRPKGSEEISLEAAIEHKLFVYHTEGNSRMTPPPGLELRFLNAEIRALFDRAFTGAPSERPSALEWYESLEKFEKSFTTCEATETHKFFDEGEGCPWCRLEDEWRVALFGAERRIEKLSPEMDLEKVWKEIEGIPVPATYEPPEKIRLEQIEPAKIKNVWMYNMTTWIIVASILVQVLIQWMVVLQNDRSFWLVAPLWGICLGGVIGVAIYGNTQVKRFKGEFEEKSKALNELLEEWKRHASLDVFESTRMELEDAKVKLGGLEEYRDEKFKQELENIYGYELKNYLQKYSILVADIGGSSKSMLSRLHDNGVKTAADIDASELADKHKVSNTVVNSLVAWKQSLEQAFWNSSPYRLSTAHMAKVERELTGEAEMIRRRLTKGANELESLSVDMTAHQRHLGPQLHAAHHEAKEAARAYKAWLNATGRSVPIAD